MPERIASAILSLTANKIAILLLINVLLLWVGTFMEALAAIVILTPILLPLVTKVGVDPVHFGVIMVVNLAIGFVTPPVGVNLFVACGITKQKIELVSKAAMPFILTMLAILLAVTFWPPLSALSAEVTLVPSPVGHPRACCRQRAPHAGDRADQRRV